MGKIIVSESVSLDGVFDAQTMGQWAQPFLVRSGMCFFKDGMAMTKLKLVESKTLSLGVLALTYEPAR